MNWHAAFSVEYVFHFLFFDILYNFINKLDMSSGSKKIFGGMKFEEGLLTTSEENVFGESENVGETENIEETVGGRAAKKKKSKPSKKVVSDNDDEVEEEEEEEEEKPKKGKGKGKTKPKPKPKTKTKGKKGKGRDKESDNESSSDESDSDEEPIYNVTVLDYLYGIGKSNMEKNLRSQMIFNNPNWLSSLNLMPSQSVVKTDKPSLKVSLTGGDDFDGVALGAKNAFTIGEQKYDEKNKLTGNITTSLIGGEEEFIDGGKLLQELQMMK